MIDELNVLEREKEKHIPIERYFKEMDLTDEQVKEREQLATDLKDLFMLFFLLFRGNNVAGNIQDIDYYNVMINRQYKELLETYSLISYLDDDMVNAYIPLMIASTINTTLDNQEEPYILSEIRAEFLAEDQTNTVCNEADYNRAIQNGATHKRWITEKDDRVRKTHKAVDDKVIEIKQLFQVGNALMRFPKDTKYSSNVLREIIGCRCSIKYLSLDKTVKLDDITIHKSVGAQLNQEPVTDFLTMKKYYIAGGTKITNVEVFAGKGTSTKYHKAYKFVKKYGGKEKDWQHCKGYATLDVNGELKEAEIHWSQCKDIGRKELFVKKWLKK